MSLSWWVSIGGGAWLNNKSLETVAIHGHGHDHSQVGESRKTWRRRGHIREFKNVA